MLEADDAINVIHAIASNLIEVSKNNINFAKLPDTFWGYFARGHDGKGKFAVIIFGIVFGAAAIALKNVVSDPSILGNLKI